jgi:hypothetical protein
VLGICDHWSIDKALQGSIVGRPLFNFEPRNIVNFNFKAAFDPDPIFHCNADPDPASKNYK